MLHFFENLSTRELAWVIWFLIAFTASMFSNSIRHSFGSIIKALLAWKISVSLLAFFLHTAFYVLVLFKFGLWDISLLKDTIIWSMSFGFVSLKNINKVNNSTYFKKLFFDTIKWTIVIEFIINFFTFSFIVELIVVPIVVFTAAMQAYASHKPEHKPVESLFKYILMASGAFIFIFSLYKTVEQPSRIFTFGNFKSFFLPIFLSITFLPFMYVYNLIVKYEELWVRLNFSIRNKQDRKRVKRQILYVANFNIDKLVMISKNIAKPVNNGDDLSYEMIKKISKGQYKNCNELSDK